MAFAGSAPQELSARLLLGLAITLSLWLVPRLVGADEISAFEAVVLAGTAGTVVAAFVAGRVESALRLAVAATGAAAALATGSAYLLALRPRGPRAPGSRRARPGLSALALLFLSSSALASAGGAGQLAGPWKTAMASASGLFAIVLLGRSWRHSRQAPGGWCHRMIRGLGLVALLPTVILVLLPMGMAMVPSAAWPGLPERAKALLPLLLDPPVLAWLDFATGAVLLVLLIGRLRPQTRAPKRDLPFEAAVAGFLALGLPPIASHGLADLRIRTLVVALAAVSSGAWTWGIRLPRIRAAAVLAVTALVTWAANAARGGDAGLILAVLLALLAGSSAVAVARRRELVVGWDIHALGALILIAAPQAPHPGTGLALSLPFFAAAMGLMPQRLVGLFGIAHVTRCGWLAAATLFSCVGVDVLAQVTEGRLARWWELVSPSILLAPGPALFAVTFLFLVAMRLLGLGEGPQAVGTARVER